MMRSATSWLRAAAAAMASLASLAAQTPGSAALAAWLAELDAAFARGDLTAYDRLFTPDDAAAHAAMLQQLATTFARTTARTRTSKIVGEPRVQGAFTVVRVHHEIELRGDATTLQPHTAFGEDWLLVLRARDAASWTGAHAIETGRERAGETGRWQCAACNYEIGPAAGWLCVPLRGERAGALEGVSFHLLGSEVALDVAVRADDPAPPTVVAQRLADTLRELDPACRPGVAAAWLPPAHAAAPPTGLAGAQIAVDAGDQRLVLHVAALGGLQHVLTLRGTAASLRRHDGAVRELLASYRWHEPTRSAADAIAAPFATHQGGELTGGHYRNHAFGVDLAGAAGWQAQQRCGGAAFRVVWTSPRQSRFWLAGYGVPCGMQKWCRATAERWLEELCTRRGLELLPTHASSTPWEDDETCLALTRTIVARSREAGLTQLHWLRLVLRDELLLLADGSATNTADEADVQAMLQALRRR